MSRGIAIKLLLGILLFSTHLSAQKEDHQWIYHFGAIDTIAFPEVAASILDFNQLPPIAYKENKILIFLKESHASICDEDGQLLLYSNAQTVHGPDHVPISNGDTINHSATWDNFTFTSIDSISVSTGFRGVQQVGFVPQPETDTTLVFYQDESVYFENPAENGIRLLYGKIVSNSNDQYQLAEKDILLNEEIRINGKLTACKHANGRDWWLLQFSHNEAFIYLIDNMGIRLYSIQNLPFRLTNPYLGQAKFSPQGDKLAMIGVSSFNSSTGMEIMVSDFDRSTGVLVSPELIRLNSFDNFISSGLEFSPNGELLYYSSLHSVQQIDLSATDIESSIEVIAEHNGFNNCNGFDLGALTLWGQMQLAPDNKIYLSLSAQCSDVHVIHNPNVRGRGCDLEQNAIILPTFVFGTIPTLNTYRLGPLDGSPADTLGLDNHPVSRYWYEQDSLDFLTAQFWDVSYFRPEAWEWQFGDGNISSDRHPQHRYDEMGIYEVCLTVSNENSENTSCQTLNLGVTSSENPEHNPTISIFPNPTEGRTRLVLNGYFPQDAQLFLYDVSGQLVSSRTVIGGANVYDFSELPAGTYVYEIVDQGRTVGKGKVVRI